VYPNLASYRPAPWALHETVQSQSAPAVVITRFATQMVATIITRFTTNVIAVVIARLTANMIAMIVPGLTANVIAMIVTGLTANVIAVIVPRLTANVIAMIVTRFSVVAAAPRVRGAVMAAPTVAGMAISIPASAVAAALTAMAATTTAVTTTATAMAATTTAVTTTATTVASTATSVTASTTTILGVGAGAIGNRVRDQNDGSRQHASNGSRQYRFFEQHMDLHISSPGRRRENAKSSRESCVRFLLFILWEFFPQEINRPPNPEIQAAHGEADRWLACYVCLIVMEEHRHAFGTDAANPALE
jgi:hypothetical protein